MKVFAYQLKRWPTYVAQSILAMDPPSFLAVSAWLTSDTLQLHVTILGKWIMAVVVFWELEGRPRWQHVWSCCSNTLRTVVEDQIAYYMVLPNKIPVQMAQGVDMTALRYPVPQVGQQTCPLQPSPTVYFPTDTHVHLLYSSVWMQTCTAGQKQCMSVIHHCVNETTGCKSSDLILLAFILSFSALKNYYAIFIVNNKCSALRLPCYFASINHYYYYYYY